MKGRSEASALIASLSIVTGILAFLFLVFGAQDSALGRGVFLGYISLMLLVLWIGDMIVSTLHNT